MFSRLDLFGKPVTLNFDGKEKSRSKVGAWFTLLFFGFICWATIQLGQDLVARKNPKTIMSESFEENPPPMIISPDTFNLAFGLQHPTTYAHYIDESIYTVKATREQLKRIVKEDGTLDMIWTTIPLITEICTKEHFGPYASKFETIELNQLYCLKKDQPELSEIQIQGVFESPLFEYVSVLFEQCDNQTSGNSCAPRETINSLLGGGWFATYFTNLAIEPRNYSYPNVGYRDSFYTSMSNNYFKEITLWLSHVEVTTDYGWLTKEKSNDDYIKLDHTHEFTNFSPTLNQMIKFAVRVGKITQHYERSYIKVPDVIAQTNGFLSAGLLIGLIILMPYSNLKFYERLINDLFDVQTLKNRKKDQKCVRKRSRNLSNRILNDNLQNLGKNQEILEDAFERNALSSDSLSPLPHEARKSPENCSSSHQIIDFSHSQKISNPFSPRRKNSDIERKYIICENSFNIYSLCSLSCDIKETQPIKLLSPNTKSKGNKQTEDERPLDSIFPSPSYSSYLLKHKPQRTEQPRTNIVESFDIQTPEESFIASDNINEEVKSKQSQEEFNEKDSPGAQNNENFEIAKSKMVKANSPNQNIKVEEIIQKAEKLPEQLTQSSYHINISFWEYFCHFFWKSGRFKEKFGLLNEGIRRIEERLNVFNLFKKLREIDKLKLLLLENDQLILFDALPNPELSLNPIVPGNSSKRKSLARIQLKESKFIAEKRKNELVKHSYIDLRKKTQPTMIDNKLLEIYEDIIDF